MESGLEDLKGNIYEFKFYVPDLYLPRPALQNEFTKWLGSDLPCFAVIGESGMGKTNFMCATAESQINNNFVLFYSAQHLPESLAAAITNDFVWEFRRESNIAHIVERFDDIVTSHGKKLIIFVDALDEFVGSQEVLKAELRDFVHRITGSSIRICLSCKAYDWERYVIDDGQTYNRLARLTYPKRDEVHNPQRLRDVDSRNVGIWIGEFTDIELESAFAKYKEIFSLQGELKGDVRSECKVPLMLRLMAEVYTGQNTELPADVSSKKLFDKYWQRKMGRLSAPINAEQILSLLARISVESGNRHVALHKFRQEIDLSKLTYHAAYQDLLRLGLLRTTQDHSGVQNLSFGFEKLRSYAYAVHTRNWVSQSPPKTAREICALLEQPNQLRIEAVEFYLTVIDRGETDVLTEIALLDLRLFAELIDTDWGPSSLKSSVQDLSADERSSALLNRLIQYAQAYSRISRHYFPNLCTKIVPYTKGDVGVWVSQGGVMYQFRSTTDQYPEPVIMLPPEVVRKLLDHEAIPALLAALGRPKGTIQVGMPELSAHLPQKVAWNRLMAQVANLLGKGLLDESTSPSILQERTREVLLYKPNIWFGGVPDKLRNFERLGFDSEELIYETPIDELMLRMDTPLKEYLMQLEKQEKKTPLANWYLGQIEYFILLKYWLDLLKVTHTYLEKPSFKPKELFSCIRNPVAAVPIIENLVPHILQAYRSMVERNFPQTADWFTLYRLADRPILFEATCAFPRFSDFVRISYILLGTVEIPEKYVVYSHTSQEQEPFASQDLTLRKSLRGSKIRVRGGTYGQTSITTHVDGHDIAEPQAIVYRTDFPSRHPISDQVYQLISAEAQHLFGGRPTDWPIVGAPGIDYEELALLISRQTC